MIKVCVRSDVAHLNALHFGLLLNTLQSDNIEHIYLSLPCTSDTGSFPLLNKL